MLNSAENGLGCVAQVEQSQISVLNEWDGIVKLFIYFDNKINSDDKQVECSHSTLRCVVNVTQDHFEFIMCK